MLIKRSQRSGSDRRGSVAESLAGQSSGLDRRTFLRKSGLAGGALAALGALPVASVRKAEAAAAGPLAAGATVRKSICTHCSVGCTVTAEVLNGVWIGQEPSWDSPINRGSHCAKGASVRELVHSDRRLRYPMKLVGGQWTRVSWDTAINEIGDKFLEMREKSGPDSIYWLGSAKMTNEGAYLFRKLGAFWGTNNTDHQARICHSTTVTGVANTWGYGAMTNSFNDIRNAKTQIIMGGNPAEAHPVSLQHLLEGKELQKANFVVIDPRLTRTAAHATEYVRMRPGTDIPVLYGMMWHILQNGWEDKEFIRQRVYGFDDLRKEVEKWNPEEVERVTGVPGEQLKRVAKMFATEKPATLIWAMGQTQKTVGTANVRASCIALLMTGNVGRAGAGANIFRGHDNVQGATDVGLDIVTLPFYYGLAEGAWKHWSRVWDVDYEFLKSRFDSKQIMETPGIPLTRWFEAVTLPKDQVAQKDNVRAVFVQGHASNSITRIPESLNGLKALELLVIADPHPTTWASLSVEAGRKDGVYILPVATQFECKGSRVASNRSLQWGEQIVKPIFESKDDLEIVYLLAKKFGFADQMFKKIKVENNLPEAEDVLREMNRGSWSTGYCGQSPERLKAHMKNQAKFDMLTMRAPKDDPEVGGDYYGLPWPCWGSPEVKHPGTPLLYNTNLHVMDGGGTFRPRFGVEREEKLPDGTTRKVSLLADGSYSKGSAIQDGYPEFTLASLKKLGWDTELTEAEMTVINRINPRQSRRGVVVARPFGRHPARRADAWLCALWQRQGTHACLWSARSHTGSPRADLHAARRSRRQIPDAARRQAVPGAQYRLLGSEGSCREGDREAVSADPVVRPSGRIRGRRRGDAYQPLARRTAAGHVHRDQPCRRRRPRHQGRRLGLGHWRREQFQGEDEGARHRARRQRRCLDALPLRRLARGQGSSQQLPEGHRSDRAR
ncbi:formate dehydrogenase major subunit [Bradyrhizobium japonicum]